jgi:hypothetical protein
MTASPETPLRGHCACGNVQFEVTAPFCSARYCHCHRCQHRTGTSCAANAELDIAHFHFTAGEDRVRFWQPPDGQAKWYCLDCGGQLFSRPPGGAEVVFVRLGAIEGDPGIRPQYHQWVSSAATWEPIPDDGLPRYDEGRPSR